MSVGVERPFSNILATWGQIDVLFGQYKVLHVYNGIYGDGNDGEGGWCHRHGQVLNIGRSGKRGKRSIHQTTPPPRLEGRPRLRY